MELTTLIATLLAAGPALGPKGTGSAAVESAHRPPTDLVKQRLAGDPGVRLVRVGYERTVSSLVENP